MISMHWSIVETTLQEISRWEGVQQVRAGIHRPTLIVARLPGCNLVLAMVIAPQRQYFQALLGDYPNYVSGYAALSSQVWAGLFGDAVDALIEGLRGAGLDMKSFPRLIDPPPENLRLKRLGTRSKFRHSPFALATFLLPDDAFNRLQAYLNDQLEQFDDRAFFTSSQPPRPIQWSLALGDIQLEKCPDPEILLAMGLPEARMTTGLLQSTHHVLKTLVDQPEPARVSKVFRARPTFLSTSARRRLVTTSPRLPDSLIREVNLLRAAWLKKLAWPDFYGEVAASLHQEGWPDGNTESTFRQTLEEYLAIVRHRYPVVEASPFSRSAPKTRNSEKERGID